MVKDFASMYERVLEARDNDIQDRIRLAEGQIDRHFEPGDRVLLFKTEDMRTKPGLTRKLLAPASTGYLIQEKVGPYRYLVLNTRTKRVLDCHVNRLLLDLSTPYELRLREEGLNQEWRGLAKDLKGKGHA